MSKIGKSKEFYRNAGPPRGEIGPADWYRFKRVASEVIGTTVIDVGCGKADFLGMVQGKCETAGIDMNQERVDWCNERLGREVVFLGNLDHRLDIADSQYDNVVCMEVLEHLERPEKALEELCRISKRRVIITVPYNETIPDVLCIHCGRYTPWSGHLHSFNEDNFRSIVPAGVSIVRMEPLCNRVCSLAYYLQARVWPLRRLPPPQHLWPWQTKCSTAFSRNPAG